MPGRTPGAKGPKGQPDAFRSCISCMLSAQSRDANTAAAVKALEADHSALQAENESLRTDKDGLVVKVSTIETELNDATAQLSQTGTQATEAKSLVDALTEEKIDLASRLADTEAMRSELAELEAPARIVAEAEGLGMIEAPSIVYITVPGAALDGRTMNVAANQLRDNE